MPTHLVRIEQLYDVKAANKNWEAITVFVDVFVQHRWKKNSSFFFFSFYFLNAQADNYSNTVYVLGHKYILGPFQSSF